jgi:hypothetical protein
MTTSYEYRRTRGTSHFSRLAALELERRGYKVLWLNKDSPIQGLKYDYVIIDEYRVEVTNDNKELNI